MTKAVVAFAAVTLIALTLESAQPEIDPFHFDVYGTPYYGSKSPVISGGRFSSALLHTKRAIFLLRLLR